MEKKDQDAVIMAESKDRGARHNSIAAIEAIHQNLDAK